ncbi:MAG: oligosaccharide flippase family protein [Acidobacteriaceae bacterium]|nr:oligosaccharide flippase family protein [Acidobacteriaceae bacterium]
MDRALYAVRFTADQLGVTQRIPASWRSVLDRSVQQRIASGAAWSLVGAGFQSGFTMVSNIACARLLNSVDYGQLGIVLSTINLCTALFTSGLSMTATRYVAEYRDAAPRRAGTIIGLSTATSLAVGALIAMIVCLLAPWLSRDVLHGRGVERALTLGAVSMLFAAINGSQMGALSGFEAFRSLAIGNFARGVSVLVFVTMGAAFWGLNGALVGYIIVSALTALFYQIMVRRRAFAKGVPISYCFNRQDFRVLWRFTIPVLLTTSVFTPAAWWSNVLLVRRSGYAESGIFSAVYTWQTLILFFPLAVSSIGLPMLSNLRTEGNMAKYKKLLGIMFLLIPAPAIIAAVPVALCSPWIMNLYGASFHHGAPALTLISIAAVLSACNIPVGHALWSLNATIPAILLALLNGGTLIIAAHALATKGAAGLASAYVIMTVFQSIASALFMTWLLRKKLPNASASPEFALA